MPRRTASRWWPSVPPALAVAALVLVWMSRGPPGPPSPSVLVAGLRRPLVTPSAMHRPPALPRSRPPLRRAQSAWVRPEARHQPLPATIRGAVPWAPRARPALPAVAWVMGVGLLVGGVFLARRRAGRHRLRWGMYTLSAEVPEEVDQDPESEDASGCPSHVLCPARTRGSPATSRARAAGGGVGGGGVGGRGRPPLLPLSQCPRGIAQGRLWGSDPISTQNSGVAAVDRPPPSFWGARLPPRPPRKLHSGSPPPPPNPGRWMPAAARRPACHGRRFKGREANRRRHRPTEPTTKALCQTPPAQAISPPCPDVAVVFVAGPLSAGMNIAEACRLYFGVPLETLVTQHPPIQEYSAEKVRALAEYLTELGADPKTVVSQFPKFAGFTIARLKGTVAYLHGLGVNVSRLMDAQPVVFSLSLQNLRGCVEFLKDLGVDVPKIINDRPDILRYTNLKNLRSTVAYLQGLGVNVPKVVNRHPQVLGYSMQNLRQTVAYLEELQVDVPRAVNKLPAVFGLSLGNMKGTVAYLEELQVNIATVVNRRPEVFGISMENMKRTVTSLEKLGVDAPTVINTLPSIFGLRMETNVCPKIHFVTERMGRSVAEINRFPPYLGYSLQQRILPRYEFLVHCRGDANGVALASMLTPADEVFARRVAGSTLEEYQRWKAESWDQDLYVSEGSAVLEE